jgi:hypothetical protein
MQASGMCLGFIGRVAEPDMQQVTMRMRLPATDLPGQIADRDMRSVVEWMNAMWPGRGKSG